MRRRPSFPQGHVGTRVSVWPSIDVADGQDKGALGVESRGSEAWETVHLSISSPCGRDVGLTTHLLWPWFPHLQPVRENK